MFRILKEHIIKNELLRNEFTDLTMRLSQLEMFTKEQGIKSGNRYSTSFNRTSVNKSNTSSSGFQTTRPDTQMTKNFLSGSIKTLQTK